MGDGKNLVPPSLCTNTYMTLNLYKIKGSSNYCVNQTAASAHQNPSFCFRDDIVYIDYADTAEVGQTFF